MGKLKLYQLHMWTQYGNGSRFWQQREWMFGIPNEFIEYAEGNVDFTGADKYRMMFGDA